MGTSSTSANDHVYVSCHSSAVKMVWSRDQLPLSVITIQSLFQIMGSGSIASIVVSVIPTQWRDVFHQLLRTLSIAARDKELVAQNIDLWFAECVLTSSLPPEAMANGSYLFPSVVALPNTNKGLNLTARNVSLSWVPWGAAPPRDVAPLLAMVAFSSGNASFLGCSLRFVNISFVGGNRSSVDSCMCVTESCVDCNAQVDARSTLGVSKSTVRGGGGDSYGVSWVRPSDAALRLDGNALVALTAVFAPDVVGTAATNVSLKCNLWNSARGLRGADVGGSFPPSSVHIDDCSAVGTVRTVARVPASLFAVAVAAASVAPVRTSATGIQVMSQMLGLRQRCNMLQSVGEANVDFPPMSDASSNPFGIAVAFLGDDLEYAGGSLLSWAVVAFGVFALGIGVEYGQRPSWSCSLSFANLQLPGSLYGPLLLAAQPWCSAAVVLIVASSRSTASLLVGCVVVVGTTALALLFVTMVLPDAKRGLLQWKPASYAPPASGVQGRCGSLMWFAAHVFDDRWRCLPRTPSDVSSRDYHARYGRILSSFRPPVSWFPGVEAWTAVLSGALSGVAGGLNSCTSSVVDALDYALAVLSVGLLVVVLLLRPYSSLVANILSCESSILTAAAIIVITVSPDSTATAAVLLWVQCAAGFLPLLWQLVKCVRCRWGLLPSRLSLPSHKDEHVDNHGEKSRRRGDNNLKALPSETLLSRMRRCSSSAQNMELLVTLICESRHPTTNCNPPSHSPMAAAKVRIR